MILVKNQKIKIIKVMCNGKAYYYLPIDVNCKIFVIIKYDKCSRIMIKYLIKILLQSIVPIFHTGYGLTHLKNKKAKW